MFRKPSQTSLWKSILPLMLISSLIMVLSVQAQDETPTEPAPLATESVTQVGPVEPLPTNSPTDIPLTQETPLPTVEVISLPTEEMPLPTEVVTPLPTVEIVPVPTEEAVLIPTEESTPIPTEEASPVAETPMPLPTAYSDTFDAGLTEAWTVTGA